MEKRKNMIQNKNDGQLIFGTRAVLEAIHAGKEIDRIFIQKDGQTDILKELISEAAKRKVPYLKVPAEKLNRITRKAHQGVIAYLSAIHYASIDNVINGTFEKGKDPLVIILDRVTDVRNFGAIARTAECAGADCIVIPDRGSALINSDAMKTSAGALNHIPVCREKNLMGAINFLKNSGLKVVAATEKTDTEMYDIELKGPLALVFGSEEDGISEEILSVVNERLKIPLFGKIESLNVSVSVAVVLYEAVRKRVS